ncbi:Transforming growth factor-beta receptor-associated protein 1 [Tolypocladium ophioglossoides CBS 100239]|uniref:Transforming growth factor-beta receptor-associated protein 1 n=1 Tax=Tolypocladium ophioglossoides (strain CBS 100239) TaxID=1163406 RepID=A0A0L0N3F1_TOLOC|nr:Transforming growth factor-beta receptor-associated protein 1 [Tolypocladium ophioglossoides CBS 100239]
MGSQAGRSSNTSPDGNFYVGTSASELLHFVQIPPDPADKARETLFILASRLSPAFSEQSGAVASSRPGVQQILLLPRVGKACILCNYTVTFYSLPELSPVSGIGQVRNCGWIGGVDLNETAGETAAADVTILLSLKRRIQVVRVGDRARAFKNIDYAGSTLSVRRDSIACVADSKSYALLDVDRQLKIPLMSISSLDEPPPPGQVGQAQSIAADTAGGIIRSASSAENRPQPNAQSHSRSASHGGSFLGNGRRHERRPAEEEDVGSQQSSPPAPSTSPQPPAHDSSSTPSLIDKPLPAAPPDASSPGQTSEQQASPRPVFLKPHVASPAAEEFLLVMGTSPLEPGIGMFVNLDGEPTRSPIQFERYPKQIAVDGTPADLSSSRSGLPDEDDGYVLASMAKKFDGGLRHGLEIQRCGAGNESPPQKYWLEAAAAKGSGAYGLRTLVGSDEIQLQEIVGKLCHRRFSPFPGPIETSTSSLKSSDSRTALSIERLSKEKELFERDDSQDDDSLPDGWEATRNSEGEEFARRLAKAEVKLAVWVGDCIWWAVRNPLIIQLDTILDVACPNGYANPKEMDRRAVFTTLGTIRSRDAKTELEFLTFGYIRQKAGLLLLISLLASSGADQLSDGEMNALEEVLVDSKLDARVVLSLLPGVRNEIVEGRRGIWIYGGVREVVGAFLRSTTFEDVAKNGITSLGLRTMNFLRRFLSSWRKMKGFGSVPDEIEVFHTVDAALLTVLLELDQHSPNGLGKGGAVRSELYDLVDRGVDCFYRAVDLLESCHRLFVLSRLYQSRKMAGDVLATWRRIIEGEQDDGQELRDGEERVREYLKKVSNQALVREYGVWLANRNPRLGVQVFAEDQTRAPKFEPARAVEILREEAPNAVKYYLEYLVFGKGHGAYVNELIAYYLDVVLGELESSAASRAAVTAAYDAYRALPAPKPTYHHFLTANAPDDDEAWQSRLRLLQLLGGAHDYDSAAIRARISSLPGDLLVPETIILAGRKHHHEEALRLLVHRLGDYDTAVSYCLRGGTSVYVPAEGRRRVDSLPEIELRRRLFQVVLHEFLAIDDVSDRVEQTGALLERFGGWFEVEDVLRLVPDSWSVDILAGFLVGALRRLVLEKHESTMTRALSGAENLRVNYDLVVGMGEKGPSIEAPN